MTQVAAKSTRQPERLIRVFCHRHKLGFQVFQAGRITCETKEHELARNFPYDTFWEYCCDCRTYSPSEPGQRHDNCSNCELAVVRRYLCDQCHMMSIECDGLAKRRDFTIPEKVDQSFRCPGCLQFSNTPPVTHVCDEASFAYKTARATCPFCDEILKADDAVSQVDQRKAAQTAQVSKASAPSEVKVDPSHREKRSPGVKAVLGAGVQSATKKTRELTGERRVEAATSRSETRVRILILAGVFLIFLVAATFYWLATRSTTTNDPAVDQNTQTLQPTRPGPVPPGMVYVQGGEFNMGINDGDEYEKPTHSVSVKPFLIDITEVTCQDYEKFVKETGHKAPPTWVGGTCASARKPVTGVDWYDANEYAKWAHKRLPTEQEWEFAARGTKGWRYPWGNDWKSEAANAGNAKTGALADVGSFPEGSSPFGTKDMVGNAWEWTSSEWEGYPGGASPPDASSQLRVIRGGFWGSSTPRATTTFRRGWDARGAKQGYENTGFRCAADVTAPTRN